MKNYFLTVSISRSKERLLTARSIECKTEFFPKIMEAYGYGEEFIEAVMRMKEIRAVSIDNTSKFINALHSLNLEIQKIDNHYLIVKGGV